MAMSNELKPPPVDHAAAWGLVAIGVSGPWEISLNQNASDQDRWLLQIECPDVSLSIPISSPGLIQEAIQVLSHHGPAASAANRECQPVSTTTKSGTSATASLVQDDEFPDRFFLLIESSDGMNIRFTITRPDVTHLLDALSQLQTELSNA